MINTKFWMVIARWLGSISYGDGLVTRSDDGFMGNHCINQSVSPLNGEKEKAKHEPERRVSYEQGP